MRYRYRSDDELKDSGVEWLGKIPKDWEVLKLRNIGNISTSSVDKKINEDEKIVNLVNYVDVYNSKTKELFNNNEYMKVSAKETQILVSDLLKGDVLFTPSSEIVHDIGYSAVVMEDLENTLYSYHLIRLRFKKEIYLNFKKYMFWSNSFLNYLSSRATGTTRKTLSISNFKDNIVTIPNIKEQEKIANFLDEKTSQFDLIISKKEKLIERLEEAKKSLISEVVTGKVKVVKNDDGYELIKRNSEDMKDSGVEWIGEIPKDWEVKKFKHLLSKIGSGKTPKGGAEVYVDDGILFIRSQNVHNVGLKLDDVVYISHEVDEEMKNSRVYKNDVLLNITGASIGRTSIFEYDKLEANVNQHVCILRPKNKYIIPTLLNKIIQSGYIQEQIQSMQTGSSREGLNFEQIGNMRLIIDKDIRHQEIISEYLDINIDLIENMKSKAILQIQKLKEAKQSLISEAVTGKIEILD